MTHSLENIIKNLDKDINSLSVSELRKKYLSKNGILPSLFTDIKNIPSSERKEYGQEVNSIKQRVENALSNNTQRDTDTSVVEKIDPTAPFDLNTSQQKKPRILDMKGSSHVLMQEIGSILEIFQKMGFDILESRQIDDDFHMFESLNFPKGHPARDMYDTFWTDDGLVLPAHTSTMQNRALRKFGPPPIRVVLPGRCFRHEATDASHEHTFYQIEGIYVDRDISVANMLATIKEYLQEYLGKELDIKMQPAFFPFTEPDIEFIISCPFCDKKGCSTCGYIGWIELMGCGMIHPNVLTSGGIDPKKYTGFAWGVGIDRLTAIRRGIGDIRKLREGDIKFLNQF
ncbi:phenylalanine--tRNA ligase subunit alpha [Candidatus Dojkabacteria bacterium]|uniref:Phenylalanine--tRNA ligase alpha subunit n=1 Tax=Candidatus Dojkabacteria bacterium TaxID=2099670 RepID=A0A847VCL9_9BACT|nr:phenylalanine--tRNA ligase subunit alpha [Candidatus Dojkabacteria bacterium]